MLTAREILPGGHGATDRLVLAFDDRHRRRLRLTTEGGTGLLLDLPHATVLEDGNMLRLSDGRLVAIVAADEPLMHISAPDAATLARLAWHIGNRHLPADIRASGIRLRWDHVIAHMLEGLGATVTRLSAPFNPESGAYAGPKARHEHSHAH